MQLNWIKRFYRVKQKPRFGDKVQESKDGSGLQFINFDFITCGKEIKDSIPIEF